MTAQAALNPARVADFERALRNSRRVRRLRLLLPALSLVVALGVIGAGAVARIGFGLGIDGLSLTAEGLQMDAPRLSGSDGRGRTYTVTATNAVQDFNDPKVIRLFGIAAEIRQADGSWAKFDADSGIYDSGREKLRLDKNIRIRTNDGNAADLSEAAIDLKTGQVDSDAPVAFSSALGSVEAQGMKVDQKRGSVTFTDGVRMTVDPKAVDRQSDGDATLPVPDTGEAGADGTQN
ncbi:LPS export ABC transporter periplasmic protein LptC [Methylobrevis pamukkalensis]|uniref:Lipopolysaccharide-assembly, LptC-related protein n=1 Tax=Methylobrevis pamukkalensis TaxID=1439726 RepID=A0A1E3GZB6_9HYPH|nr:LPS export ABC transporter periplasmic protein LptC [Methylobrevis pamukkalensis]ODN69374.1 Lipopolysaccharide-assembly, LptC-related protein [Methylobrevis pamukkalensis]